MLFLTGLTGFLVTSRHLIGYLREVLLGNSCSRSNKRLFACGMWWWSENIRNALVVVVEEEEIKNI